MLLYKGINRRPRWPPADKPIASLLTCLEVEGKGVIRVLECYGVLAQALNAGKQVIERPSNFPQCISLVKGNTSREVSVSHPRMDFDYLLDTCIQLVLLLSFKLGLLRHSSL